MQTDDVRENERSFLPLAQPIAFGCRINGVATKATVTHRDSISRDDVYYLCFDDGYQGTFFFTGGETELWFEENVAVSPYARAVPNDLNAIRFFNPTTSPQVIRVKNEKEAFNVWIKSVAGVCSVYYKSQLRFSLYLTDLGWGTLTNGLPQAVVDEDMLGIVLDHLPNPLV